MTQEVLLTLQNVQKKFGATLALRSADLQLFSSEVVAVVGENGSGKTTLLKIIMGLLSADDGHMHFLKRPWRPQGPFQAVSEGIFMIAQESALVPELSVEENIYLPRPHSFYRKSETSIDAILNTLGLTALRNTAAKNLTAGQKQLVEIARAFYFKPKILLLDEPTSRLSFVETQKMFYFIRELKSQGVGIIYISHFLDGVIEIADRYVVLRDGSTVSTGKISETNIEELVQWMVGRKIDELYPARKVPLSEKNILKVKTDIQFDLFQGEIHGFFGLVGAGRSEALRALQGLDPVIKGVFEIEGESYNLPEMTPQKLMSLGVSSLSENVAHDFLFLPMKIRDNILMSDWKKINSWGFIPRSAEVQICQEWLRNLQIKAPSTEVAVETLSGGNQQRVALSRCLQMRPQILFLDEPTRGIDLGTKSQVYQWIRSWSESNLISIVFVSSYIEELMGLCDRISVFYKGEIVTTISRKNFDKEDILKWASVGNEK